jgi:hypothetical protein
MLLGATAPEVGVSMVLLRHMRSLLERGIIVVESDGRPR